MKMNSLEMTVNAGDATTGDFTTQQGQSKSPAVSNVRVRSDSDMFAKSDFLFDYVEIRRLQHG